MGKNLPNAWNLLQGNPDRMEVAGISGGDAQTTDSAFEVAHFIERSTKLIQKRGRGKPLLHRILPFANERYGGKRLREPIADSSRAHGCDGAIQYTKERRFARGIAMQGFEDFKIAERGGVEHQKIPRFIAG